MADFEILVLENGSEIGITPLTERAEKWSGLAAGSTLVFKSRGDARAIEYVETAESEGLTFAGREHLDEV